MKLIAKNMGAQVITKCDTYTLCECLRVPKGKAGTIVGIDITNLGYKVKFDSFGRSAMWVQYSHLRKVKPPQQQQ